MSGTNIVNYVSTPGLTSLLDYSTTWGQKQWIETTKKLVDKSYDGNPQNLKFFLDRLVDRVEVLGWESITKIQGKDLVTQYSIISTDECREKAKRSLILESPRELKVKRKT